LLRKNSSKKTGLLGLNAQQSGQGLIQRLWFCSDSLALWQKVPLLAFFGPLAWLTRKVSQRRFLNRRALGLPAVPTIVVGNLLVGGTGKTPVTLALARHWQSNGYQVGIVTSGYGRRQQDTVVLGPGEVATAQQAGDEALLYNQLLGVPVGVARKRDRAVQALLTKFPAISLIIADDGLQHARLARDLELVVFDERGLGNQRLLPAGPLREPLELAVKTDAWLFRRSPVAEPTTPPTPAWVPDEHPRLFDVMFNIQPPQPLGHNTELHQALAQADQVIALAGIGQPERFFQAVSNVLGGYQAIVQLGDFTRLGLPDHASPLHINQVLQGLSPSRATVIFTTQKDAVKIGAQWHQQACWFVLPIEAHLPPKLLSWLDQRLLSLLARQRSGANPHG
jgi:tetraacyldisaccharide 4'-kinase